MLLDARVRTYGDNIIAAAVAEDTVVCDRACQIKVEYEEWPVTHDPKEALAGTEHLFKKESSTMAAHTHVQTSGRRSCQKGHKSVDEGSHDPAYHHFSAHSPRPVV